MLGPDKSRANQGEEVLVLVPLLVLHLELLGGKLNGGIKGYHYTESGSSPHSRPFVPASLASCLGLILELFNALHPLGKSEHVRLMASKVPQDGHMHTFAQVLKAVLPRGLFEAMLANGTVLLDNTL